jgi:hypothetical protein
MDLTLESVSAVTIKGIKMQPDFTVGRARTGWHTRIAGGTFTTGVVQVGWPAEVDGGTFAVDDNDSSSWDVGKAKV